MNTAAKIGAALILISFFLWLGVKLADMFAARLPL